MAKPVYYLKYRPSKVNQLDLKAVREQLAEVLSAKTIPHAFLFSGPKGLGKTSAARIVAKSLNCPKGQQSDKGYEPCGQCPICQSIAKGTSLDLIEIDAASNRGIDDIRQLKERIKLAPSKAENKVYVIDEVHMLTKEAFNALLKTLEEPPEHAYFILCTTQPEKLPETIISRCQQINFHLAKKEEIVRSLKRIVKGEDLKVKEKTLVLIAKKAQGSFRDAAKLLQQLSFKGKRISHQKAVAQLEKESLFAQDILKGLAEKDLAASLNKLEQGKEKGIDLKVLTQQILEELRQVWLARYGLARPDKKSGDYELKPAELKKLIVLFDRASRELRGAAVPQLPLEMAMVEYSQPESSSTSQKKLKSKTLNKTEEKAKKSSNAELTVKWEQVLEKIKKDNHHIEALLKPTVPKEVEADQLIVEVFYQFHQNKLEEEEKMALIKKRVEQVFGQPLEVKFELKEKKEKT